MSPSKKERVFNIAIVNGQGVPKQLRSQLEIKAIMERNPVTKTRFIGKNTFINRTQDLDFSPNGMMYHKFKTVNVLGQEIL